MVAILVVLTILVCIGVDAWLQWSCARRARMEPQSAWMEMFKPFIPENIALPAGVFVAPGHTWLEVIPNGRTHIGLDDFLMKAIGKIDDIELPVIGKEVRQGEPLFTIKQGDRKIEVPAPIDGTVNSVNETLTVAPELARTSPYKHSLCDLTPKNLAKNLKEIFIAEEALNWIKSEVQRFYNFLTMRPFEAVSVGHVLQDGGVPTCGVLEFLDNETWNDFAANFIRTQS
ncbi:MAG TPA: glycine cleavage system protein H [Acidobacteriota bacterium]|nr:glycine cleavage system protein H [Acidobacteriota bacterium]